jgi:hypothetical protein
LIDEYDYKKIDGVVLALFQLTLHDFNHAWKGLDWFHQKGLIDNPVNKTKSVIPTREGLAQSARLFEQCFRKSVNSIGKIGNL